MSKSNSNSNTGVETDVYKVSGLHSISTKIVLMLAAIGSAIIILLMGMAIYESSNTLKRTYSNYCEDLAKEAAVSVDSLMAGVAQGYAESGAAFDGAGAEEYLVQLVLMDPEKNAESVAENIGQALADIKLAGVESSYAYMVSADGTMIYHPTTDKIGNPVENEAVKNLVARLEAGETPESIGSGSIIYTFKGAKKFAGYAFTAAGNMVIVTGDSAEILSPISSLVRLLVIVAVVAVIIALLLFRLGVGAMLKPLRDVTDILIRTSNFDFSHTQKGSKLAARKDEIGMIAKATSNMRKALRSIVNQISGASNMINTDVTDLQNATEDVNVKCTDNSATTQELAAAMEETAATTQSINNNIVEMKESANGIEELAARGEEFSDQVMSRAGDLRTTTIEAVNNTRSIYETVKAKADEALKDSKAVDKINELTDSIMSISDQTSLLSLNASIEAARAGEAGKGFAVVAGEIGSLANQTSESVANINSIVGDVITAVKKMADCLEETNKFLSETVLSDYAQFTEVSEQYREDADQFKNAMLEIKDSVNNLNANITQVADAMDGINNTMEDVATGVSDIAGKTTDIVDGTSITTEKVDECKDCVRNLEDIVGKFVLE